MTRAAQEPRGADPRSNYKHPKATQTRSLSGSAFFLLRRVESGALWAI